MLRNASLQSRLDRLEQAASVCEVSSADAVSYFDVSFMIEIANGILIFPLEMANELNKSILTNMKYMVQACMFDAIHM